MLYLALVAAGLIPGAITAWLVRRKHGWRTALLAGLAVTLGLPVVAVAGLLWVLVMYPPLAIALGLASAATALHAFDRGDVWTGVVWAATTCAVIWIASWRVL